MNKNKRDSLAREYARKYHKPYKEMRKEVCRKISEYFDSTTIEKNLISEEEYVLNYLKNKYDK